MNEQEKKKYLDEYKKEKEKGVPFFPDIIFKIIAALWYLSFWLPRRTCGRSTESGNPAIPHIRCAPSGTSSSSGV
jgi:hypothetical protein